MPKPDIALSDAEWLIVQNILNSAFPHARVWAFGSRARKTQKPYSDLDLAVIADQALELSQLASVSEEFSASDLPWKVDVIDWFSISDDFRKIIEAEKVILQ